MFSNLVEVKSLLWSFVWLTIMIRWLQNRYTRLTGLLEWWLRVIWHHAALWLCCAYWAALHIYCSLTLRPLAHLDFPTEIMWKNLWHKQSVPLILWWPMFNSQHSIKHEAELCVCDQLGFFFQCMISSILQWNILVMSRYTVPISLTYVNAIMNILQWPLLVAHY